MNVSDNGQSTELMKNESIQQKVQREIDRLSRKKRKHRSSLEKVRLLQLKLYLKASREKSYKFYILYDKVFQKHILEEAYVRCKANKGSPGVDGMTFKDVEEKGRAQFLGELREALRKRTYRPQAVKRVWIEKANGGKRPLGIPTIRDRVAQQACKMVIEPIWEADFDGSSYGFRPGHSASDAVGEIRDNLKKGKQDVYDADLSKYFDTIPHEKLEAALRERISDPRVLHLIKLWLKVPTVEEDGTYTGGKSKKQGTPQGGVISPLLANIYMNLLDRIVNRGGGYFDRKGIKMIRYADDFILMSEHIAQEAIIRLHHYLDRMGLIINKEKSKQVKARDRPFEFLGFAFRYDRSVLYKGGRFWNIVPRPKSQRKVRQSINARLKSISHFPPEDVVSELNPIIRGWMNYYRIKKVSYTQVAFRKLNDYCVNVCHAFTIERAKGSRASTVRRPTSC